MFVFHQRLRGLIANTFRTKHDIDNWARVLETRRGLLLSSQHFVKFGPQMA